MKCPGCGGKTDVFDSCFHAKRAGVRRRRRCRNCKGVFGTWEFPDGHLAPETVRFLQAAREMLDDAIERQRMPRLKRVSKKD